MAHPMVALQLAQLRAGERAALRLKGKSVHPGEVLLVESSFKSERAASGERSSRSGRMSRLRIADSLPAKGLVGSIPQG